MINFSARGKKFGCTKEVIQNKWKDCFLKSLVASNNIQIDKYEDSIYIDINPLYLDTVLDYLQYNCICKEIDLVADRDLMYLGLKDINIEPWKLVPLNEQPLNIHAPVNQIPEYCFIITRDNNKVVLNKNTIMGWPNCKFRDIICGNDEDYIVANENNTITISINLNYEMCNLLISIMRDRTGCYLDLIINNNYVNEIVSYYNIINENEKIILNKRYQRMKNKPVDVIINENGLIYFSSKDRETETFEEHHYDFEWNNQKYVKEAPFKIIKNSEFRELWAKILETEKHEKNEGYEGRDYYCDQKWIYNITKYQMDHLEILYYKYLLGFID